MPVLDIELSDSEFLRNCNTVVTELSEKSIREKDIEEKTNGANFLLVYSAVSRITINGSLLIVEKKYKAREGCVPLRINERVT